jgi:hypothetical protein
MLGQSLGFGASASGAFPPSEHGGGGGGGGGGGVEREPVSQARGATGAQAQPGGVLAKSGSKVLLSGNAGGVNASFAASLNHSYSHDDFEPEPDEDER